MSHDRKFTDTFMLILGALVVFSIAMIALSSLIGGRTQKEFMSEDPEVIAEVERRISPVGVVAIKGEDVPASGEPAPVPAQAPAPQPEAMAAAAAVEAEEPAAAQAGKDIYNGACMACHTTGIAGAPKIGDAAAWEPRVARGMEAMYANAINGYVGSAGVMPAKGGRADLSDDAVRAAVDYMVAESQ